MKIIKPEQPAPPKVFEPIAITLVVESEAERKALLAVIHSCAIHNSLRRAFGVSMFNSADEYFARNILGERHADDSERFKNALREALT